MRHLTLIALLTLTGCATFQKGSGLVAHPLVSGVVQIASQTECEAYAQDHPKDAATLRPYLAALSAAAAACVAGLESVPAE